MKTTLTQKSFKGSLKIDESNPNHHIWRNGRYWCIHFVVRYNDKSSQRIRRSLKVENVEETRMKRDKILKRLMQYEWVI